MQKYPYYIPVQVDAGQMRKLFRNKKYETYLQCVEALVRWSLAHKNVWDTGQFALLEYTSQYQSRIIGVFTDGDFAGVAQISDNKYF